MYDNQVNQSDQSTDHKIMYVGPPPKPDYFCMDQIHKFHYSELQNLILYLFQNIFKTEELKIVLKTRMELSYLRKIGFFEI